MPLVAKPGGEAQAYAESHDRSDRSLYLQADGDLLHAVHLSPPAEEGGTWIGDSVGFDHHEPTLAFDAMSFDRPRQVRVEVEGRRIADLALTPAWRSFALPLPAGGGRKRVRRTADGCISPRRIGLNDDPRCLGFRVAGLALARSELFRPLVDPSEQRDLSDDLREADALLARRLRGYRFTPAAEAGRAEPSEEQVERLRALGYLP